MLITNIPAQSLDQAYEQNLKKYGVKLPKEGVGRDTLEVLYKHIGKPLSKTEINLQIIYTGPDNQEGRGLKRKGWNVVSERKGEYTLKDLTPHPEFEIYKEKRKTQNIGDWLEIKKRYDYRCASCGSAEGQPHLKFKGTTTKLEKGHMDPTKDLTDNNCIPQCQICNKLYKDKFIFDNRGHVIDKNYKSSLWQKK